MKSDSHWEGLQPHVNTLRLKAILVVDDDQQLASALQWILADENFLVDVAFDGRAALLKVKAHEYDAVICDLKMPRVDGMTFYRALERDHPDAAKRILGEAAAGRGETVLVVGHQPDCSKIAAVHVGLTSKGEIQHGIEEVLGGFTVNAQLNRTN